MPGFGPRPYRHVLGHQVRDLLGAVPDACAALFIVAAIGCACVALDPASPARHAPPLRTTVAQVTP